MTGRRLTVSIMFFRSDVCIVASFSFSPVALGAHTDVDDGVYPVLRNVQSFAGAQNDLVRGRLPEPRKIRSHLRIRPIRRRVSSCKQRRVNKVGGRSIKSGEICTRVFYGRASLEKFVDSCTSVEQTLSKYVDARASAGGPPLAATR